MTNDSVKLNNKAEIPERVKETKEIQERVSASDFSIIAENVAVKYRLAEKKVDNLKEYVIRFFKRDLKYREFLALDKVTLSVKPGERLAVMGKNGAGKSTLLKIISGVQKPTEGKVLTKGRIAPLLELGAGFDMQYTGEENIWLYGAMLGLDKTFIKEKFDEICQFSELNEFLFVPVKNYSSGMRARLGFSIATITEPDILILDEVLSVGDAAFRKKSESKIKDLIKKDTTVVFVSHNTAQVKSLCTSGILLDHGRIVFEGSAADTADRYEKMNG